MSAHTILEELNTCGIELECMPDGKSLSAPANTLTPHQRAQVIAHKVELFRLVQQSAQITAQLHQAAMRACDHWQDSTAAREQMRQDCLNTPLHLRAELLTLLCKQYGGTSHA